MLLESKINILADSMPDENLLLGSYRDVFLCPHMAEGNREPSGFSSGKKCTNQLR